MTDTVTTCQTEEVEVDGPACRQGWEEQFRRMAEQGDDNLLDGGDLALTQWEETGWEW